MKKKKEISTAEFREAVNDRLMTTVQVAEFLGLTVQGVRHRRERGALGDPILVVDRGFSLWDREQVVSDETWRQYHLNEHPNRNAQFLLDPPVKRLP